MKKRIGPDKGNHKLKKVVPDTSAIINGRLTDLVKSGKMKNSELIIPRLVMGELQAQASKSREIGFEGLEEIKKIRKESKKQKIKITFYGDRAAYDDIRLSRSGRLDALIQDIAKDKKAVLVTCDLPQALSAEAEGIKVEFYESYKKVKKIKIEKFLTKDTMSVHLKEGIVPMAKRGRPGEFKLVKIGKKKMKSDEIENIQREILDSVRHEEDASLEIGRRGASVVQLRNMRIAITRPPFSDALEVTCVRPITKLFLDDYKLSNKLKERLENKAEGILISGPPGSGKTTFATSLAEFYLTKDKIIKTMETPRDLDVPKEVTQYSPLEGSFAKTSDILLLVRPDYTIFDEIRKTNDFEIFSDMRLAGVGMIGVMHSSAPVEAVERFIGRIDLGVIPHVVDTIVFIKSGKVENVYSLSLTVKVPNGMTEADLARPVVEVKDFENDKVEFEIYTYGEQTVVIPVKEEREPPLQKLAKEKIKEEIRKYDSRAQVEFLSPSKVAIKVSNDLIPRMIGKEGKNVRKLEEKFGIGIDIEPLVDNLGKEAAFTIKETGAFVVLHFSKRMSGKNANVYVDNEYLFSATVGRKGTIKMTKDSDIGKELVKGILGNKSISVYV